MKYYSVYSEITTMDYPNNKKKMCHMTSVFADSVKDAKWLARDRIMSHGYFVLRMGIEKSKTAIKICEDNKNQQIASFTTWEEIDRYFGKA